MTGKIFFCHWRTEGIYQKNKKRLQQMCSESNYSDFGDNAGTGKKNSGKTVQLSGAGMVFQ